MDNSVQDMITMALHLEGQVRAVEADMVAKPWHTDIDEIRRFTLLRRIFAGMVDAMDTSIDAFNAHRNK